MKKDPGGEFRVAEAPLLAGLELSSRGCTWPRQSKTKDSYQPALDYDH